MNTAKPQPRAAATARLVLTSDATPLAQVLLQAAQARGLGSRTLGTGFDLAAVHAAPLARGDVLVHDLGDRGDEGEQLLAEALARRARRLGARLVLLAGPAADAEAHASADAASQRRWLAEAVAQRCAPDTLMLRPDRARPEAWGPALQPLWDLLAQRPAPAPSRPAGLSPVAQALLDEALSLAEQALLAPNGRNAARLREAMAHAGWGPRLAAHLAHRAGQPTGAADGDPAATPPALG